MKTTTTNFRFKHCAIGLALFVTLLAGQEAKATTGTWKTAAGGTWNTVANWTGGIPLLAGDTANLTGALAATRNVTVNTTVVIGTMNLGITSGTANPYTVLLTSGSLTFNNNGSGAVISEGNLTPGDNISCPFTLADNLFINNTVAKTLTISGAISDATGKSIVVTNVAGGTLLLSGTNTYTGTTSIAGGTTRVTGSLGGAGTVTVNANATLAGAGTFGGAVNVQSGGNLAPGTSAVIGAMTFSNNVTLGGTNTMKVNRDTPAADSINMASGTVTLGGVLSITNLGSAFQNGDVFTLISGTISGSYGSITPTTPGPGLQWDMSHLTAGGNGILHVVAAANHAPVANNDSYTLPINTAFTTNAPGVLANDTDADSDPLTAVTNSEPTHGTITFNSNGSFTYTPNNGFSGSDSFTYQASDGQASSSTATVTLNVIAGDQAPVAVNDSYSLSRNSVFTTNAPGVLANDTDADNDPLTATNFTSPSHGILSSNANGSFTYTPTNHYAGADSFTYQAFDGQTTSLVATVTLTVVDHPPVAVIDGFALANNTGLTVAAPGVLANDTDADSDTLTAAVVANPTHGSLTLNGDGSFTFTPNATYFGSDSFTYQASDGLSNSTTTTVILTNAPGAYTWNGGTSGSWNTAANWSANDLPIGKAVRYDNTSTANFTETLDRIWSITGLTVSNVSSPITIANGNTLTNTGSIDMSAAGADLSIFADYVSAGNVSVAAGRTLTMSNILGGSLNSLTGPGTFRLVGAATIPAIDCSNSITFIVDGGSMASNPPVRLDAESGGTVSLIVTNNGAVIITPSTGTALQIGRNGNTGTPGTNILSVASGSILISQSGNTSPNAINVPGGAGCSGIFNLNGGLVVLTNKYTTDVTTAGETRLQIPNNASGVGTVNLNGGTLVVPSISGIALTTGSGTLNFNGTTVAANRPNSNWITNIQNAFVQSGGAIFDTGTNAVTIGENLQAGSPSGGLTKQSSGTLTLKGVNTYTGTTLINNGTLALSAGGAIANSATIAESSTATFDISGLTTSFTLGASQTLSGNGTNVGPFINNGVIVPGSSGIGTLTFSAAPTLTGGTLQMEISGPGSADKVVLTSGALTYDGTLTVVNAGGALNGGEVFTLFSPAGSGVFAATNLPALGGGLNWWLGSLAVNGSIAVNRAPVAGNLTTVRASSLSVKIAIADLLTNVSDADGDLASLTSLGASGQGATITQDGTFIYYTPANNNNDSFSYTVQDGRGGSASGTVFVTVNNNIGGQAASISSSGGTATAVFGGIPGYPYEIQRATNVNFTGTLRLWTTNAPANGIFSVTDDFSDIGGQPSQAYYRLHYNP